MTYFPISQLKRADYNPRIMPDTEMQALMKSIEEHGFVEPIVVNVAKDRYGVIVGGHQRLTAVERLIAKGHVPKEIKDVLAEPGALGGISSDQEHPTPLYWIPCFTVELDLEHEKILNIGLNRIHGKFEEDKLYSLVVELKTSTILPSSGLRDDEISRILDRGMVMGPEDEEEGEGLPAEPRSKLGEIYELGPHRLICGDSTDPEMYEKLLGKEQADMIWTDPPYNVAAHSRSEKLQDEGKGSIMNDNMDPKAFAELIDKAFVCIFRKAKIGASFYICTGWQSYPQFVTSMMKNGFYHSGAIVWVKPSASLGWSDYHKKHEWIGKAKKPDAKTAAAIIYGWQKDGAHTFFGDNEFDVWEMPRKNVSDYLHPTEKPDWLPMRAVRNSTKRGDIVLDCFAGSGSVMSACEKTGRRAFMIELDPKFCDVIRDRWERMNKPPQDKKS